MIIQFSRDRFEGERVLRELIFRYTTIRMFGNEIVRARARDRYWHRSRAIKPARGNIRKKKKKPGVSDPPRLENPLRSIDIDSLPLSPSLSTPAYYRVISPRDFTRNLFNEKKRGSDRASGEIPIHFYESLSHPYTRGSIYM